MAGTNAAFDADAFRSAIRTAMTMGAPNKTPEKVTFRWSTVKTYTTHDPAAKPYSWDDAPATTVSHADVVVPVAVRFVARPGQSSDTVVGQFDTSRVELTLLDDDYDQIVGADLVIIGGNTYMISFVAPPSALFEVDVYTIYADAADES